MSLVREKNKQSEIIWDILYCSEVFALFGAGTNEERAMFINFHIKKYKNKQHVYKCLKRVAASSHISDYVTAIGEALLPQPEFRPNIKTVNNQSNFANLNL